MRTLTIGVLVCGLAASACNRAETPALASTALAPAGAASDPGTVPVATVGRAKPTAATPAPATAAAATAAAATSAAAMREVTIPAGTRIPIVLDTPVGSDTSRVEQAVQAHLSQPIVVHGQTVLPTGSHVSGVVTDAAQSGKVKGRAHFSVRFTSVTPRGDDERYSFRAGSVTRTAPATKKRDAMEIGIPAAGGAVVGGLLGGKKGALIGGAAAGGAGSAVVMNQRGKEVRLGKGAPLILRLSEPLTIRVKS
jgi:hypothetical protein